MDSSGPHRSRSPRGLDNHCDAESFALDLLWQDRSFTKEDIVKLFDLLPKESHSGARDADKPGDSFTTGLYARVKVSLRRNCRLFPNSTKVIARFVLQVHPDQAFSSIIIFDSVETAPHIDALNAPCDNLVVGLTEFSGGDLWVEWPPDLPKDPSLRYESRTFASDQVMGALLPVSTSPVLFCAKHLRHETCPFKGRRVVLVAYALQALNHASPQDRSTLANLGFRLPDAAALKNPSPLPPRVLFGTDEAPSKVPSFAQIFSGDGALASGFRKIGWDSLAIDLSSLPGRHNHQPVLCELLSPTGQDFALQILQEFGPTVVYLRPPCKTAMRARSRALPASNPAAEHCPPLRSDNKPWGLDPLTPKQSAQVRNENKLFEFCVRVLRWALDRHALVVLEGPHTSFLWQCLESLPAFQSCADAMRAYVADSCMLGGDRPSAVRFLTNITCLQPLLNRCPGPHHKHAPFGSLRQLPAHPQDFVQCIVHACCQQVSFRPAEPPARPGDETSQKRKSRQLMPEFAKVVWIPPDDLPKVPHKVLRPDQGAVHGAFNTSSASLRGSGLSGLATSETSGFSASPPVPTPLDNSGFIASPAVVPSDDSGFKASPPLSTAPGKGVTVGIYATPVEFVDRARALQHPMAGPSVVCDSFKKALFANLTRSPSEIARARASFMDKVSSLVERLQPAEDALHASFPRELRQVLKGKRLLLFKELLEMYNYDDPQVWQLLRDGPTLTGCQDHPPYAERRYRPSSTSTGRLEAEAAWRRRSISAKTLSPQDAAILTELGASEVEAGFISGPFRSEQEVSEALGRTDWVATPRFVLLQGAKAKPRVIDDCRASGLNSSFSSTERLRLQDLDYVVAMVRLAGRMSCKHSVRMDLSSGEVLCGDRVLPAGSEWLGRCVDLAKAYKQMAVPRAQRHLVVLCHHDEDGSPLYHISESLPFGAEGSVYGFVRTSRALSFLINEAILVPSSVYFDDFPALSPRALAKSATESISFLLSALGWKFSTDPEKAKDFSSQFDVLGCSLDLSNLVGPFGFLEVKNKPNRVGHITDLLDELGSGRGDYKLIPVIQGQLNFASNFVMGRAISPLARSLSSATSGDIKVLCNKIKDLLAGAKPRRVSWHSPDSPMLIFTDAAFEKGRATLGAVVIDTLGGPADIYDGELPAKLLASWQRYADEQIICQAELAAAVSIRYLLRKRLAGRKCIYFIDNESARFALIRAVSGVPSMQALASLFHVWDEDHPHYAWVERVPSASNPADLPSRGCVFECIKLLGGHYSGSLDMPPGTQSFDPLGDVKSSYADCPLSLVTIAASKD